MPIIQKLHTVATKAKSYVLENKQTILNTVMFLGLTGVSAAVVVLTRENKYHYENAYHLEKRTDYIRERMYFDRVELGLPVHTDDARAHELISERLSETTDK